MILVTTRLSFKMIVFGQERLFSNDGRPLDVGSASTAIRKPLPLEDPIGGPLGRFTPRQMPGGWADPPLMAPPRDAHENQPPTEVITDGRDGILDLDQLLNKPMAVNANANADANFGEHRLNSFAPSAKQSPGYRKSFSRVEAGAKENQHIYRSA